jgi:UDP-N-acetyl-D-glucosamine dehydrogenase
MTLTREPVLPDAGRDADTLETLLRKFPTRDARVAVMGLGYVGLPLLRLFASKGFRVIGCDVDQTKIDSLNRGRSYIRSVPSSAIARHLAGKQLLATTDFRSLASADAIFVCVPTPLTADGKPDVSAIRQTAKAIAATLRKGQLIILESTSYPGTTREIMKPELERRGLECGRDFFLAFSPEREDPGNKDFTIEQIPKIVGGIDEPSRRAAAALYREAVAKVVEVSSAEAAEAAKLLENIYRCVNIALVNELKMCLDRMNIDVWEVIGAAATKPFGFQAFYPGPGLGGHCIPIDPFYLSWKAREFQFNTRFIDLAGEINIQMPYYVMAKLEEGLRGQGKKLAGSRILMLGLAYKKDIDDPRESPAFKLLELLQQKGASVVYNDPNIPRFPDSEHYKHLKVNSVPVTSDTLAAVDAAVIVTNHSDYDYEMIARYAPLIVDTRNACAGQTDRREKIVRA